MSGICQRKHCWQWVDTLVVFPISAALIVGAAVTFHAIVEIANTFLDVLGADFGRRVFVAAIAGVTA